MRVIRTFVFCLLALCFARSIASAAPVPIDDPDKYAAQVMGLMVKGDTAAAANVISESIGKPGDAEAIKNTFGALSAKTVDYSDKVLDKTFGKSLREIVYYSFIDNLGFVYYRFNFKMSSRGWLLANFNFKSETNELFPKDFIEP